MHEISYMLQTGKNKPYSQNISLADRKYFTSHISNSSKVASSHTYVQWLMWLNTQLIFPAEDLIWKEEKLVSKLLKLTVITTVFVDSSLTEHTCCKVIYHDDQTLPVWSGFWLDRTELTRLAQFQGVEGMLHLATGHSNWCSLGSLLHGKSGILC